MPRGKTDAGAAARLKRLAEALELRRAGLGFEEIGQRLGIQKSQAHRDVSRALDEARAQIRASADEMKTEDLSRLDALMTGLWPRARKGEAVAVDRVLKIMERRAKLLGLDAPTKVAETDPAGNPVGPRTINLVAPDGICRPADPA
jgi:hypothetical protein